MEDSILESEIQPAGFKSPTIISLQLAGWLVFICLWLPLCRGCGGAADKIPIHSLQPISVTDLAGLFSNFMLLGSYCNGLMVAFFICVTAWFKSERLWRIFFLSQFCITATVAVIVLTFGTAQSPNLESLVRTILGTVPALLGVLIWIGIAIGRNDFPTAWARLQHAWTIAAFFFIHLMTLFQGSVRYGYWLTMIGLGGLVVAVELARYRMQHDLWDASKRVVKPQFSIRSILFWTAFFPVVFSYYRSIEPFCNWLFQ